MRLFSIFHLPLCVTLLTLLTVLPTSAQKDLGWEPYDSVKIDLSRGVFSDRYLPFDVPFYLYGSAQGIEEIRVSLIQADQQACCVDFLKLDNPGLDPTACDCPCESITEQRLKFYRMVREVNRQASLQQKRDEQETDFEKRILKQIANDESLKDQIESIQKLIQDIEDDLVEFHIPHYLVRNGKFIDLLKDIVKLLMGACETEEKLTLYTKIKEVEEIGYLIEAIKPWSDHDKVLLFADTSNIEHQLAKIMVGQKFQNEAIGKESAILKNIDIIISLIKSRYDRLKKPQNEVHGVKNEKHLDTLINTIKTISHLTNVINSRLQEIAISDTIAMEIRQVMDEYDEEKIDTVKRAIVFKPLITLQDSIEILQASTSFLQDRLNELHNEARLSGQNGGGSSVAKMAVYHALDTLYQGEKRRLRVLQERAAYHKRFFKKYKKKWRDYTLEMEEAIRRDSLALCEDCGFNPNKCNFICSWKRDTVLNRTDSFFLQVPPLSANKNYKFFFEISRVSGSAELNQLKKVVAQNIAMKTDSVFSRRIDFAKSYKVSLGEMRKELLYNDQYLRAEQAEIEDKIIAYLQSEYEGLNEVKVGSLRFRDKTSMRTLLNHIISHKYYKLGIDTLHDEFSQGETKSLFDKIVDSRIICELRNDKKEKYREYTSQSKRTHEQRKRAYFKAKQMHNYHLLDTFNILHVKSKKARTSTIEGVPTGLLPYDTLQKISLRRLDSIASFNPDKVEAYITNLKRYDGYLSRVQSFVVDSLIKKDRKKRLSIFVGSTYPNSSFVTPREKAIVDNDIINELFDFSDLVADHQMDVREAINIYSQHKKNLTEITDQLKIVVDSVMRNNQKIKLAVLRSSGGLASANFKTRTDWVITADVGVAYLSLGSSSDRVLPYAGVNFNFAPINREAHYSLFKRSFKGRKKRYPSYLLPEQEQDHKECYTRPFWERSLWKASSLVVGVTSNDISEDNERDNLIGDKINIMTGYGLRLTDALRLSTGVVWNQRIDPNPLDDTKKIVGSWYVAFSIDVDVKEALGKVGSLLNLN